MSIGTKIITHEIETKRLYTIERKVSRRGMEYWVGVEININKRVPAHKIGRKIISQEDSVFRTPWSNLELEGEEVVLVEKLPDKEKRETYLTIKTGKKNTVIEIFQIQLEEYSKKSMSHFKPYFDNLNKVLLEYGIDERTIPEKIHFDIRLEKAKRAKNLPAEEKELCTLKKTMNLFAEVGAYELAAEYRDAIKTQEKELCTLEETMSLFAEVGARELAAEYRDTIKRGEINGPN